MCVIWCLCVVYSKNIYNTYCIYKHHLYKHYIILYIGFKDYNFIAQIIALARFSFNVSIHKICICDFMLYSIIHYSYTYA